MAPIFVEKESDDNDKYREDLLNEIDIIVKVLDRKEVVWVPIRHKVTSDQKDEIEKLDIAGLGFDPEESLSRRIIFRSAFGLCG